MAGRRSISGVVILVVGLIASTAVCADAADREFLNSVTNLAGPDVSAGHLITDISTSSLFQSKNDPTPNLKNLLDVCVNLPITFDGKKYDLPTYPYKKLAPLLFCSAGCRLNSLVTTVYAGYKTGYGSYIAMIAVKGATTVTLRQAIGRAEGNLKEQTNVVSGRTMTRGLYPHEIETVQTKVLREAALAIKREVSSKTGLTFSEVDQLSAGYLDDSNKLRNLIPVTNSDHSELDKLDLPGFGNVLKAASNNLITDGGIISRIQTLAQAASRSSFLFVVSETNFFVGSVTTSGSSILLRLSNFKVSGKLPNGAFATSTGSWKVERAGASSTPSLNQLLAVFPPLKG